MVEYSNVKRIVQANFPKAKIKSIKEFTEGYNNITYKIRLDIGNFVVKLIKLKGYEKYLLKQEKIRSIVRKKFKNFPIARILKSDYGNKIIDNPYIILEMIDGESLQSTYPKIENKDKLYEEIGELYGKLHSIKMSSYGELDSNLHIIKKYKSWYNSNSNESKKLLEEIKEKGPLPKKTISQNEVYFRENRYLLKQEFGPCLCHGDAADTNLIVKKIGKQYQVNGLIDFEFSRASGATKELFNGLRSFDRKYAHRSSIVKGYTKWSKLPKDWEKLIFFYQWMAHLKQLTKIKGMKLRNLSYKETLERKKDLRKKSIAELKKIVKQV